MIRKTKKIQFSNFKNRYVKQADQATLFKFEIIRKLFLHKNS